ncbi:tRNA (adenosine(37)-N6)-threonylcarbamoyltransferase complex dimerization subunit type 1 TsaB [Alicyclobacillus cycloheptanicus]|uniref:tRNA threonylcarbamoyladenosine biosynthesis protein TsaB n=1 Tax=Alicyclobacillus cycloheptanicus TaxID=1457 RepID=A0ABT9XIB9_9BACL|nr:tRNA (adenosine(37)-N6)-threonylcarbamoyltransferase complex dimerization subunit type 1 TsaB [Alicyclobacillus cycloheptanicus]MDQ0190060.1 tRNA threonylcarbamoyladenosine biosynthesis protein TsaB [Alicyclobacillus cycloheptanicus]WDM02041.1 tRNA (adenosine(37)-N6)-threonylcarbamoyltransferase complex dimerization subunit type 1 TsaB [Alicyclobacillus cycloheptanicus]
MAVLAMDTATETLVAAVGAGGTAIASAAVRVPRGHSRLLQPTVQQLLRAAGLGPEELTGICVGIGPGSYTGVRMAVSTAKAMAVTLGIPLYTVSTLLAMAEAAVPQRGDGPVRVMPLLYARRARAFGAAYTLAGAERLAWQVETPVQVRPIDDWLAAWRGSEDGTSGGSARTSHGLQAEAYGTPQVRFLVHDFNQQPSLAQTASAWRAAADVALALCDVAAGMGPALLRLADGGQAVVYAGDDIHAVSPDYALPVEAEAKLAERGEARGNDTGRR